MFYKQQIMELFLKNIIKKSWLVQRGESHYAPPPNMPLIAANSALLLSRAGRYLPTAC